MPLQLNVRVERLADGTWMSRRDAKGITTVDEDTGVAPYEIGSRWMSGDEVGVEGDAEGVNAIPNRRYLPYTGSPHARLVIRVVTALKCGEGRLRGAGRSGKGTRRVGPRNNKGPVTDRASSNILICQHNVGYFVLELPRRIIMRSFLRTRNCGG